MVASERVTVSAMNVGDCFWIRSSWNGMKKNPLRNVLTSSSCSASACDEEPKIQRARAGAAVSAAPSTSPLTASRKKKMVLASRRRACWSAQS